MKNFSKMIITIIMVITVIFTLCACENEAEQLKGTWYEEHGYLKLDIDEGCTVTTYQYSSENPIYKEFEYKLEEDKLKILNDDGEEVLLNIVTDEDKKIHHIYYIENEIEIIFTKDEKQPVSSEAVIIEAMNEAEEKMNEGDLASMVELIEKGKETRGLSEVIDSFVGELNDY